MLIVLSGWKRSGKDAAAGMLISEMGFKRVSFADPLKDMVSNLYKIPREWLDDQSMKEKALSQYPIDPKDAFGTEMARILDGEFAVVEGKKFHTPRSLCILEGSVKRSVTSNFWVSRALDKIQVGSLGVIADLRYRSEAAQLKEWAEKNNEKLILVRINRFDSTESKDASERDLDNYEGFDYVVKNKGTLEEFLGQIAQIVKSN